MIDTFNETKTASAERSGIEMKEWNSSPQLSGRNVQIVEVGSGNRKGSCPAFLCSFRFLRSQDRCWKKLQGCKFEAMSKRVCAEIPGDAEGLGGAAAKIKVCGVVFHYNPKVKV